MKYSLSFVILFFLVVSIGLLSCKESLVIEEEKFIKVYAAMVFMQDTSSLSQSEIKRKVLKEYNVKETDYDAMIQYYNRDPERWQQFFDSTISYIEKIKPVPTIKKDEQSLQERSLRLEKKIH